MTKIITKVFVATALLATAITASPAVAQNRAQTQGEQYNGTYHGQPMSEWTRPDSW